ncbi:nucleolar protein 4-like [Megalops cyprinoides]|uniref:nucleolar protein 4-like n=1 Tax=Megalops cyprinoides TaxID=118141 RepID=UPI001864B809|nr:nucleolar protein 4-like [Megalops cyprinoides]
MSTKKSCTDLTKRSRSPVVLEAEMFSEFQDWCLRTYGDSGKTKTVTRRKYNKIMQTLLQSEESDGVYVESSHINAKFKFWVKSKGFQVGSNILSDHNKKGSPGKPVLYVPVKSTRAVKPAEVAAGEGGGDSLLPDGGVAQDTSSLKRVAVVEDFFDIIYAMHVEMGSDPGRAPKHAGQKKTYKAIAETYAFLPREAVTRFLMSCGECQKRMHINPSTAEFKENDRPTSLVPDLIDYNMPLTATYLKQMKMQCMSANEQDGSSVSSEELDMSDPTWISVDRVPVSDLSPPSQGERMHSPQSAHRGGDDDSSSENSTANGVPALTPPALSAVVPLDGGGTVPYGEVNGAEAVAPLDFSTTSSSSSSEDQQPVNLSDRLAPGAPLGSFQPDPSDGARRNYPIKHPLPSELRLDSRDYGNKSPQYSSGSYDSVKTEVSMCAEDLSSGRGQVVDDDDDDHDDHDDSDKINDAEGMDPERLKAFNMFVRLFVDENLDRMVPISKQPKEKIQAIIESCSRQFPEFQERSRKRIRTYLKSCRRMKKSGMEARPTPPHLTSAMAETILAAACESETRNAAKRMRLDLYQNHDEQNSADWPHPRESASLGQSAPSLPASTLPQDQVYTNGGLNYNLRGYGGLGGGLQHSASIAQSNGPTDLSMKSLASNASSSSSSCHGQGGGGGGASAQLSLPEVTAVRQLIAGYRESAAFLLRSADELESLILLQN